MVSEERYITRIDHIRDTVACVASICERCVSNDLAITVWVRIIPRPIERIEY
ncbi:MAG: hypothetical protein ACI9UK_001885 [Candidatus Krumholzibacteriia bacterium]|jgi:hypothetical protein